MTPERIAELRKAMEGVTPGPWNTHAVDDTTVIAPDGTEIATTCDSSNVERDNAYDTEYERMEADALFIATFSPPVVSELLDTVGRLREALDTIATSFHGSNPSMAYADAPREAYLEHVLMEARRFARAALTGGFNAKL